VTNEQYTEIERNIEELHAEVQACNDREGRLQIEAKLEAERAECAKRIKWDLPSEGSFPVASGASLAGSAGPSGRQGFHPSTLPAGCAGSGRVPFGSAGRFSL